MELRVADAGYREIDLKIGICGSGGTGKSSLAHAISQGLGIEVIESKVITREILTRDGYDYAQGIQVERFLAGIGRQKEILERTIQAEDSMPSFVSDRTIFDLAAYALSETVYDMVSVEYLLNACKARVATYTHVFFCPWSPQVMPNGRRTLNPYYQWRIHLLIRGILEDWNVRYNALTDELCKSRKQADVAIGILRGESC